MISEGTWLRADRKLVDVTQLSYNENLGEHLYEADGEYYFEDGKHAEDDSLDLLHKIKLAPDAAIAKNPEGLTPEVANRILERSKEQATKLAVVYMATILNMDAIADAVANQIGRELPDEVRQAILDLRLP